MSKDRLQGGGKRLYHEKSVLSALEQNLETRSDDADRIQCLRAMAYIAPLPNYTISYINNIRSNVRQSALIWANCAMYKTDPSKTEMLESIESFVELDTDLYALMNSIEAIKLIGKAAAEITPKMQQMLNRDDISSANASRIQDAIDYINDN